MKLVKTCDMCPEQYELLNEEGNCMAYFRLRHGFFTVECPDVGGDTVYQSPTDGDGSFMPHEKERHLKAAMEAVKEYYENISVKEGVDDD